MGQAEDIFIPGRAGRLSVRVKGAEARPDRFIVMVHGSNLTGQTMFDFDYPGSETYSVMDALVARGWGLHHLRRAGATACRTRRRTPSASAPRPEWRTSPP